MGRPLTTLTMAQGGRLKKNQEIEPISFLQVHWALQKRCAPWKGSRHRGRWQTGESAYADFWNDWTYYWTLVVNVYDRRCGKGPSIEAGLRSRILNLNFSIQRWGGKQLLSKENKMKVDLRRKTLSFSERVETSKNEPPVFRLVSEICVGLPFCYLFIYKTNLNICLLIFLFHADHCTLYHKSGPGRLKALKQIIVLKFFSAFLPNLTKIWHW